jgi:hypothetical protein
MVTFMSCGLLQVVALLAVLVLVAVLAHGLGEVRQRLAATAPGRPPSPWRGHGFDTLVFWPVDPSPRQVELLAGEVVPLLSNHVPDRGDPSQ